VLKKHRAVESSRREPKTAVPRFFAVWHDFMPPERSCTVKPLLPRMRRVARPESSMGVDCVSRFVEATPFAKPQGVPPGRGRLAIPADFPSSPSRTLPTKNGRARGIIHVAALPARCGHWAVTDNAV
jgi:hypothetical protein